MPFASLNFKSHSFGCLDVRREVLSAEISLDWCREPLTSGY
jgi:hypothetical protein